MDMGYDRGREDEREEWASEQERERRDRGEVRTDWKPAPREKRSASYFAMAAQHWQSVVWNRDLDCCVHDDLSLCGEGLEAHHVVPQQTLRRTHAELLWHPLSGMLVCGLAHRQHHSRVRPIRRDEIPPEVVAFLSEQGFGWYLARHYPTRPQEPLSGADEL